MNDTPNSDLDIAIVGMAARFPGADTVAEFWSNLISGVESITRFDTTELIAQGARAEEVLSPDYVPARGLLSRIDGFDIDLMRFSPAETALLDPQQRVFLQIAWESFEDAGLDPERCVGAVGVFAGQTLSTYLLNVLLPNQSLMARSKAWDLGLANEKDMLATRVAYKLGLTGPAVTVQTACSTSLVAVHLALQSLLAFECDYALAGGVSITAPQESGYLYDTGSILSADGHCRPFDVRAGGTVFGNGAGAVVLMRMSDAVERGFSVRAVIKGSAINNDGQRKAGYTAPSADGHTQVVRRALAVAGIGPASIGYVEAHGTGTAVGDPIELTALASAFEGVAPGSCVIGSVKGNIGHLDNAAGIASLIKATLAVQRGLIPGTMHFCEPNPRIQWADLPFFASGSTQPWPVTSSPRRASVSSLGIGGTNAHVVLEQAPETHSDSGPRAESPTASLLTISAATREALDAGRERLAFALENDASLSLSDIAFTTQVGRRALSVRWTCTAASKSEAATCLRAGAGSAHTTYEVPRVVFMFPGQGAQYAAMTSSLYARNGIYRRAFDACAEVARRRASVDLHSLLIEASAKSQALEPQDPVAAQLSLFAVEHALAQMWIQWGVRPDACIGHSLGEYAAACMAGVMNLEQAIELVTARASLMCSTDAGAMLVAQLGTTQAERIVSAGLSIAAFNSPDQVVFSGRVQEIARLKQQLDAMGIVSTLLSATLGFHSPTMDSIVEPFASIASKLQLRAPVLPLVSNITGQWMAAEQAPDSRYWVNHLRLPVRFAEGVRQAADGQPTVFLEVGPGRTLSGLVSQRRDFLAPFTCIPCLPQRTANDAEPLEPIAALGALWSTGVAIDWDLFWRGVPARRVPLPTYAFQQKRYWIESVVSAGARSSSTVGGAASACSGRTASAASRDLGSKGISSLPAISHSSSIDAGAFSFVPAWSRLPQQSFASQPVVPEQTWVLVAEDGDVVRALGMDLQRIGVRCVVVECGDKTQDQQRERLTRTLTDLKREARCHPARIVHMASMSEPSNDADANAVSEGRMLRSIHGVSTLLRSWRSVFQDAAFELDIIARDAVCIADECTPDAFAAALAGLMPVISAEYPNVLCRFIDVRVARRVLDRAFQPTIAQLREELLRTDAEPFVALRGLWRWVRRFEELRLTRDTNASTLRPKAVHVITGGFGDLALALAEALYQRCEARLVLIGRCDPAIRSSVSGRRAAAAARVQALREAGADVMTIEADVADQDAMMSAVRSVMAHHRRIHGVFHTAGVADGTLIDTGFSEGAQAALDVKIKGLHCLEAALAGLPIDFLVLFSSMAVLNGRPGQFYYAFANGYLDAFAQAFALSAPYRVLSIGWDSWRDIGMAARARSDVTSQSTSEVRHAVFNRRLRGLSAEHLFIGSLRADSHWLLTEHRIGGYPVVPGTAHLDFVRAACQLLTGSELSVFSDVRFMTPLSLDDAGESLLIVALEAYRGAWRFTVLGQPRAARGLLMACVTGTVGIGQRSADSRVPQPTDGWTQIDVPSAMGRTLQDVVLGPRWSCIESCQCGPDAWDMQLSLAAAFHHDLDDYPLHPALLDAAWSAARLACGENVLPSAIGRLTIMGAFGPALRAQAVLLDDDGNTLRMDVNVFDSEGRLVLRAERVVFRRITADLLARFSANAHGTDAAAEESDARMRELSPQLRATLETFGIGVAQGLRPADAIDTLFQLLEHSRAPHVVVSADRYTMDVLNRPIQRQATGRAQFRVRTVDGCADEINAIFADVLNVPAMRPDDNFFTAGGDSLNAIRVVAQAKERGIELSIAAIHAHPTAVELARHLAWTDQIQPVVPVPEATPFEGLEPEDRSRLPDGLDDAYPLGSLQAGAVFHRYHAPGEAIYHDVLVVRLRSVWSASDMQAALDETVRRHAVLRTSFDLDTFREPMQLVWSNAQLFLQAVDLTSDQVDPRTALRRWVSVELTCPIDYRRAPLIRAFLHRLTEDECALALSVDDAILDGWSVASLAMEVLEDYDRRLRGLGSVSRAAAVPFREFVTTERREAADANHRTFWQEKMALCVPTRIPKRFDVAEGHRIRTHQVPLASDAARSVVGLAQLWGVPLKHLLLAVHMRVLTLIAGSDQVVTGLETNGRLERVGGELTLGQHLNTLPFVMTLRPAHWKKLVDEVAATERELLPHRRFPLASIVKFRKNGAPFDVVFNFTHFHLYERASELGSLKVLDVSGYGQTHYPLRAEFNVDHESGAVRLFLEFNECALSPHFVQGLGRAYASILSQLVAEPAGQWQESNRLSEQSIPADAAGNAQLDADISVLQLFERYADQTPDRIAVRDSLRHWTYRALDRRASTYERALRAIGISACDRVALCLPRSAESVAAILGVMKAGAAYVPLDMTYPKDRLRRAIDACKPRAVIVSPDCRSLPESLATLPAVRLSPGDLGAALRTESRPLPQQPAYVICTSGTTGQPKAVVVHHGALASSIRARRSHYGADVGVFLLTSPLTFDSSVAGLFWTLSGGGTLVLAPNGSERDLDRLIQLHMTHRPTRWLCVPALYRAVLDLASHAQLAHLRDVIVAGEPCPRALVEDHFAKLPATALHNEYGPTETTVWATVHRCEPKDARAALPVPIGGAIEGVCVHVMDARLQLVPDGLRGELCIGGSGVALGYFGNPVETAVRFAPDPHASSPGARLYRSGDIGWRDEQGKLGYLGRNDGQVKIRGHRVECSEIETVLQSTEGVTAAAVVAVSDSKRAAHLVAHVVLDGRTLHDEKSLRAVLLKSLPDYIVPARIVFRDAIALGSHGKVDREQLVDTTDDEEHQRKRELLSKVRAMSPQELEDALSHFREEATNDGIIRRSEHA